MRLSLPLAAFALLALPAVAQTTPPAPASAAQPAPAQPPAAAATAPDAPQHGRARHGYLSLDKRFQMANTTHDGHLTREQARSADVMHTVAENFDAIDTGHKGFVTEDDIRAWYKARRAARHHAAEEAASKS
jgi:hypothetical protein